eukprot:6164987-Amphidinium_carterae.1
MQEVLARSCQLQHLAHLAMHKLHPGRECGLGAFPNGLVELPVLSKFRGICHDCERQGCLLGSIHHASGTRGKHRRCP